MHIAAENTQGRLKTLAWYNQASVPLKITAALVMAGLTGLLAQLRLSLPFTPVPVTGQTLAVLMAGVLLGRKWGSLSMGIYGILGLVGVPWLNGGAVGLGATTGYLVGFVLAALFIGYMTDGNKIRSFYGLLAAMTFASLVLVYVPGVLWLGGWYGLVLHEPISVGAVLAMGVAPFISGCILKAVLAAGAARFILPKTLRNEGAFVPRSNSD